MKDNDPDFAAHLEHGLGKSDTFAQDVDRLRSVLGVSQNRLSAALGARPTNFSLMKTGRRPVPPEIALRIDSWLANPTLAREALAALPPDGRSSRVTGRPTKSRVAVEPAEIEALKLRFGLSNRDLCEWFGVTPRTLYKWLHQAEQMPEDHHRRMIEWDGNTLRFTSRLPARLRHSPPYEVLKEFKVYRLQDVEIPTDDYLLWGLFDFHQETLIAAMNDRQAGLRRQILEAVLETRRALHRWDDLSDNPALEDAFHEARREAERLIEPWLMDFDLDEHYLPLT